MRAKLTKNPILALQLEKIPANKIAIDFENNRLFCFFSEDHVIWSNTISEGLVLQYGTEIEKLKLSVFKAEGI